MLAALDAPVPAYPQLRSFDDVAAEHLAVFRAALTPR